MDLHMHALINWMVPALVVWAVIAINVYKGDAQRPAIDAIYFLAMLLIGALTWRTMSMNDPCWLIHTASLGIMIVAGVMPRRSVTDEAVHFVG